MTKFPSFPLEQTRLPTAAFTCVLCHSPRTCPRRGLWSTTSSSPRHGTSSPGRVTQRRDHDLTAIRLRSARSSPAACLERLRLYPVASRADGGLNDAKPSTGAPLRATPKPPEPTSRWRRELPMPSPSNTTRPAFDRSPVSPPETSSHLSLLVDIPDCPAFELLAFLAMEVPTLLTSTSTLFVNHSMRTRRRRRRHGCATALVPAKNAKLSSLSAWHRLQSTATPSQREPSQPQSRRTPGVELSWPHASCLAEPLVSTPRPGLYPPSPRHGLSFGSQPAQLRPLRHLVARERGHRKPALHRSRDAEASPQPHRRAHHWNATGSTHMGPCMKTSSSLCLRPVRHCLAVDVAVTRADAVTTALSCTARHNGAVPLTVATATLPLPARLGTSFCTT